MKSFLTRVIDRLKVPKTNYVVSQRENSDADGIRIIHRDTVISVRERQPHEQAKVDAMTAFIGVLANEDLDPVFTSIFGTAQELGYNLKADPYTLLHQLNDVR